MRTSNDGTDWRQSIKRQLQLRKSIEQNPFEDLIAFTSNIFENNDILKSENIQLNLQKENLQQQLTGIQQTILTGGSIAAKNSTIEEKDKEIAQLKDALDKLESKFRTLNDEHIALQLTYKSLEDRHRALSIDYDALSQKYLALKREDADRLNAENDRILKLQQERMRKNIESKVAEIDRTILEKQAAGDIGALALENYDTLDDEENLLALKKPSKIPQAIEVTIDAHEGEGNAVYWYSCSGPKDDFLATGGGDRKVKLFKISDGSYSQVGNLLGSNASITTIDVEGDSLLASSNDFATRIWSINSHAPKVTLTGHSNKVMSAKFLGVPNKVASGSQDRTIKLWDVNAGACEKTCFAGSSCFDLVYTNNLVISGHFDSKLRFWDIRKQDANEATHLIAMQSKITSLDVSRDGTKLLCSLRDNTIKCLDIRKLEVVSTYSDDKFRIGTDITRAKFSNDGQYLACGSSDGSLYIWDANSTRIERVLSGPNNTISATSWSPDGERMVSIGKKTLVWI